MFGSFILKAFFVTQFSFILCRAIQQFLTIWISVNKIGKYEIQHKNERNTVDDIIQVRISCGTCYTKIFFAEY